MQDKTSEEAHPRWPATTRYIRHGACHAGRGQALDRRFASCALGMYSFFSPEAVGTSALLPWCTTSAPASACAFRFALRAATRLLDRLALLETFAA